MLGKGMLFRPGRFARGSGVAGGRRGWGGEQLLLVRVRGIYDQRQRQLLGNRAGAGWAIRVGGGDLAATLRADPVQHTHTLRLKPGMEASVTHLSATCGRIFGLPPISPYTDLVYFYR